jgi:HD-GYP domain-containing protein (c-di-GMP phosphodiesterase class II)
MIGRQEALASVWPGARGSDVQRVLDQWNEVLDSRDHYSGQHTTLATRYAVMLGRRLGVPPMDMTALWIASHVYDLGKIAVPETVLTKEGSLSNAEMMMVRAHVSTGHDLVKDWEMLRAGPVWLYKKVLDVVLYHHERWDGNGYLFGRKGEDIPPLARIMAIADTYAAMLLDTPYRKAKSVQEALKELEESAGAHFDPVLLSQFLRAARLDEYAAQEQASA